MLEIDLSIDKVESNATAAGAYYKDMGTYYEIKFPGSAAAITVPKYYAEAVVANISNPTNGTVSFTVTGNFPTKPEIYATCEGNWTSTAVEITTTTYPTNTVTATVEVSPTTAYVGDQTTGKLTIYVPYFGKTAMGQKFLSANGSGGVSLSGATRGMEILPKKSDDTKATVKFKLEGELEGEETASPSNGSCTIVFDQNYTITSRGTEGNTQYVTAGTFSNSTAGTQWLSKSTAAGAYSYNPSTKEFTQEISIKKNDTGSNRAGAVIVYSPSGREVTRFVIEQDGFEINKLVDESDAANCYIISKPGRYELPAYEGAISKDELANATLLTGTPDVVWNDTSNTFKFYKDHLATNKIIIDINPTTDVANPAKDSNGKITEPNCNVTGYSDTISPGNALVSIKDAKGNILWSWHLWFCTNDPRNDLDFYPGETNGVMNRALGAKTSTEIDLSSYGLDEDLTYWQDGLYYQWGRKDPIYLNKDNTVTEKSNTNSYSNSKENPQKFITTWDGTATGAGWKTNDNSKSQNDPCPSGYILPSVNLWTSIESGTGLENIIGAFGIIYPYNLALSSNLDENIAYPYNGYLQPDGNLLSLDEDFIDFDNPNFNFTGVGYETGEEFTATIKVLGRKIDITLPKMAQDYFYDVKCRIKSSFKFGKFNAIDGCCDFEYSAIALSTLSLDEFRNAIEIVSFKQKRRSLDQYTIETKWSYPFFEATEVWSEYKDIQNPSMSDSDRLLLLAKMYEEGGMLYDFNLTKSTNTQGTAQVRCIKE